MEGNPLARLREFGQSVWCDDIGKDFLLAGGLKALIEEDGVSGVTSNPTIFHRAITQGTSYDRAVAELAAGGATSTEIMEALMVEDIRAAADELEPMARTTGRRDGWVSIEVAPALAYDTQGTVAEVKRIRALVDRPNILVKVPGTEEGVAAVRDLTALGYSINVTLIFSLERYRAVMEAYLSGLESLRARQAAGQTVTKLEDVHSVASFFVSRVDTMVDKRLDALIGGVDGSRRNAVSLAHSSGQGRGRERQASLQALSGDLLGRAVGCASLKRRQCPAPALGQHQYQGPRLQRHRVRSGVDRAGYRQYHASQHNGCVS